MIGDLASRWIRLAAGAALLAGCALDEAPAEPSWQVDIMPIVGANCVRCHGYPTSGYATFGMRLDSYEDTFVAAYDAPIQGAAHNATPIARRIRDAVRAPGEIRMPPNRELDDYEITVLRNWAGLVDGAMKAPRGPGRVDNAPPQLTLVEAARAGTVVTFAYELRDPDRDLVVGSLIGPRLSAEGEFGIGVIGDLVSGADTFVVELAGIPAGTYDLVVRLDDGADIDGPTGDADYVEQAAGTLVVP